MVMAACGQTGDTMANNSFVKVAEGIDNYRSLKRAIDFIKNHEVYVGIQDSGNEREEEQNNEVTNAELLYIHTNGSPVRNIPSRPVIEPAIRNDSERLHKMMAKSAQYAFDGDNEKALDQLKKTGMRGQNISRDWFYDEDNGWPPDSPGTIQAKKSKHKVKGYEPRTLIDTGQMRNAITYFVKTEDGERVK